MVRKFKSLALAGAFVMVAAPAFAQVPPGINPLGIDLDPLHIFSPATPPAPAPEPMMMRPRMHRSMMMHKKMMMKKEMMMKNKMMMKKKMIMKKEMMKKDMSK